MILYIDACARVNSRTRALADYLAGRLNGEIRHIYLCDKNITAMDGKAVDFRNAKCAAGEFDDAMFENAKLFSEADEIIIAAPFWDLSFPAVLKKYIESVCVTGVTFKYLDNGMPQGLCRAKKLYYVTTAGGQIFNESYGFGYISDLAKLMFGIPETVMFKAENLDIIGADVDAIMDSAKRAIDEAL